MTKRRRRWVLWLVLLVLLAGGGGAGYYVYFGKSSEPVKTYTPVVIERGDLRLTIQATGAVAPENKLVIKSPINGRIDEVRVKEGAKVRKGQELALMSSTDRAALLDVARGKGPAEVAHWEEIYRPTPIIAPMAGVVIARSAEPGQTISTADQVFAMSDRLIVIAQVDETDMAKVHLGQSATMTLDAYSQEKIPGTVHQIAYDAKTVNNVTVYEVQISPKRVPEFMRSGMTASVSFLIAEREHVLLVPQVAVQQRGEQSIVLMPAPVTADSDKKKPAPPREVPVKLGLSDGRQTEVLSGLQEGATVLQENLHLPDADEGGSPFSPFSGRKKKK